MKLESIDLRILTSALQTFLNFISQRRKIVNCVFFCENRVWARPDRLDEVDYALNVTPVLENYLHREFDIAYPLEKLGK